MPPKETREYIAKLEAEVKRLREAAREVTTAKHEWASNPPDYYRLENLMHTIAKLQAALLEGKSHEN